MKPSLSIIFIDNHEEYAKHTAAPVDDVEYISLCSEGFLGSVEKLNYSIRIANGKYICIIRKGDVLINDFVNEVLKYTSTRRDAILFDTVDSNGIITTYTSLAKDGWMKNNNENISLIQYFHPVLRKLLLNVMFNDIDKRRDIFAFYSKKVNTLLFNYVHTKSVLMQHDTV